MITREALVAITRLVLDHAEMADVEVDQVTWIRLEPQAVYVEYLPSGKGVSDVQMSKVAVSS